MKQRARMLLDIDRADDALRLIRQALASEPKDADAIELEGLILIRLGLYREAAAALGRAIAARPENAHSHYLYGFALREQGRRSDALIAFIEALRLRPTEPVYLRILAELYVDLGRAAEGLSLAERAVAEGADRAANFVTLGYVSSALGKRAEAAAAYREALSRDPSSSTAWNNLGCVELQGGAALLARYRFRNALRIDPRNSLAQKNLVSVEPKHVVHDLGRAWNNVVDQIAHELVAANATLESRIALYLAEPRLVALLVPARVRVAAGALLFSIARAPALWAPTALIGALATGVGLFRKERVLEQKTRILRVLADGRLEWERIYESWLAEQRNRATRDAAALELAERIALSLLGYDLERLDKGAA